MNRHNTKQAGEKRVKKPRRGFQNIKKLPIRKYATAVAAEYSYHGDVNLKEQRPFQFCQIWHNDERFNVIYINSDNMKIRKNLKCIYGNVISRKNVVPPYDVMISHRERYLYSFKNPDGRVEWKPTLAKMISQLYCVKKSCILQRHPYFWLGLLGVEAIHSLESHKKC